MEYLIEILIITIITLLFIKKEKPSLSFLFLGYFFFFVTLILQIPVKLLEIHFLGLFENTYFPFIISVILGLIISELAKYFSLKRFLKTKNYSNGILFGIAWVSLESLTIFSKIFYTFLFSFFQIDFIAIPIIETKLLILDFILLFIFNLAVTVLIINSILKKKLFYLIYGILLGITFSILPVLFKDNFFQKTFFIVIFFLYSIYIIFYNQKLRKIFK